METHGKAASTRAGGLLVLLGGIAGLIGFMALPFAQNPPLTPIIRPGWWIYASALLLTVVASVLAITGCGSVSPEK